MYRDVCGVKEPTPDAVEVERFSQGQGADPSLREGARQEGAPTPQPEAAGPRVSVPQTRPRNPLSQLLRRNDG